MADYERNARYEQKELRKQRKAPEVRFANGVAELLLFIVLSVMNRKKDS